MLKYIIYFIISLEVCAWIDGHFENGKYIPGHSVPIPESIMIKLRKSIPLTIEDIDQISVDHHRDKEIDFRPFKEVPNGQKNTRP